MKSVAVEPERRRPKTDWLYVLRVCLFLQLVAGTLIVATIAKAQTKADYYSVASKLDVQGERQSELERRVRALEDLKVAERLAVLDDVKSDSKQTKWLTYGGIVALAGNLALGFLDAKRPKRRGGDV